jgi:ABC-type iron transport system FetAB permease component
MLTMDTYNTSQLASAATAALRTMDTPAGSGSGGAGHLTWLNVIIGLAFIAFDAVLSISLGLGIGSSLIVAAMRCVLQLSVMALILDKVFAANNIYGVLGIALLLNVLGATEATFNKSKRRFTNMASREVMECPRCVC